MRSSRHADQPHVTQVNGYSVSAEFVTNPDVELRLIPLRRAQRPYPDYISYGYWFSQIKWPEVEYALTEWVDWYNNARLHSRLGYLAPTEYETAYYAQNPTPTSAGLNPKPVPNPWRFRMASMRKQGELAGIQS